MSNLSIMLEEKRVHQKIAWSLAYSVAKRRTHSRTYAWVHALKSSGLPWNVVRGVFEGSSKPLSNPSTPSWLPRVPHVSASRSAARDAIVTLRGMKRSGEWRSSQGFFISRYRAPHHVTFCKRSHSSEGSRAHVYFTGNHQLPDRLVVEHPQSSTVSHKSLILQFSRQLYLDLQTIFLSFAYFYKGAFKAVLAYKVLDY